MVPPESSRETTLHQQLADSASMAAMPKPATGGSKATVLLGSQWGDEGKGKLADILSAEMDVCARCAGGNNAGHTIVVNMGPEKIKTKFDFHLLPSGLVNPRCAGFIGSGVVVHVPSFFAELDTLQKKGLNCDGRLFISDRAHLVFDFHQVVDGLKEVELGGSSIGTTKKGIGPAYSSKASRSGLRVHHLYDSELFAAKFRKLVEGRFKRYGHFEYDTEGEIARYKVSKWEIFLKYRRLLTWNDTRNRPLRNDCDLTLLTASHLSTLPCPLVARCLSKAPTH